MRLRSLCAALALGFLCALPAGADYLIRDGANVTKTIKAQTCDSNKICTQTVLGDADGNVIAPATSAKQDTGNSSLSSIDGKLSNLPAPASSAVTETAVTVTASSAQALGSGTRRYLYLENLSASSTIACRFGATAALNTAGSWSLLPYASKVWEGSYVPSDAINCIGSTSSVPLTILSK